MKIFFQTPQFKRQAKALFKKHYNPMELQAILDILAMGKTFPTKYHDHALVGDMKGYRECHIRPDWLLVYQVTESEVVLVATGSHDDLFR